MKQYRHKRTGKILELIRTHDNVGTFEDVDSEVKKRHMRMGRSRYVCSMDSVEFIGEDND